MNVTRLYGIAHDVMLDASRRSEWGLSLTDLRVAVCLFERGGTGTLEDVKREGRLNGTAVRRSSLILRDEGLINADTKRGVGSRYTLTQKGEVLARTLLAVIANQVRLATAADETPKAAA